MNEIQKNRFFIFCEIPQEIESKLSCDSLSDDFHMTRDEMHANGRKVFRVLRETAVLCASENNIGSRDVIHSGDRKNVREVFPANVSIFYNTDTSS
jgi:hypothetical protein